MGSTNFLVSATNCDKVKNIPFTFEKWRHLPAREWAGAGVLTKGQLKEEDGDAHKRQHYHVRDEEHSSSILVAQVGESKSKKVTVA